MLDLMDHSLPGCFQGLLCFLQAQASGAMRKQQSCRMECQSVYLLVIPTSQSGGDNIFATSA
jgi:hypothetical protein